MQAKRLGAEANVPAPRASQPPPRILIERPAPLVDCGRFPSKACVGDNVPVSADVFRDGHDVLRVVVRYKGPAGRTWSEAPLAPTDHDRGGYGWAGAFPVDRAGRWRWTIEAWTDPFASWRSEVSRKVAAGEPDLGGEVSEGRLLIEAVAARASGEDAKALTAAAALTEPQALLDPELALIVERNAERAHVTRMAMALEVDVERVRARFGSWYELFPRSWGGLAGVAEQLPRLADLGFDVVYLPPVHPIGVKNRKGPDNTLTAGPGDPGSPWAIGHAGTGGHEALDAGLGTWEDFDALIAAARASDLEIALDFAIQCSADHPWLTEHPEWFNRRPDGTLKYAENPPKKYQDIYNVNWDTEDWRGLWEALLDIVLAWVRRGVRIFRVDNPHTKPVAFWEWLIAEVKREEPGVLFLAEAFTKRPLMRALAKAGFDQSYTHFPWQNATWELREFIDSHLAEADVLRPSMWVNTPDILTAYLAHGGPPAFRARLVLAATLGPTYGVYSGFEHFENVPVREGSEEYARSEKYEVKQRALDGPLLPMIGRLNAIRREHPALQRLEGLYWLGTENDALLAYAKRDAATRDMILTVVNVDPHATQEGVCVIPYELGLPPVFAVRDELSGDRFDWYTGRNFVRLQAGGSHVLSLA